MQVVKSEVAPPVVTPAVPDSGVWVGWTLALLGTLFFSIAPPIARTVINAGMNTTSIVVVRLWLAALLLGLTIVVLNPRQLKTDWRFLRFAIFAGLMNGTGMLLFFFALQRLDASIVSMLLSMSPLFVLTLLRLRGEQFTYRQTVRLALGLLGIYFLIGPGGQVDLMGVVLMFIANLTFSVHLVTVQWYLSEYDVLTAAFYITLFMAVTVLAYWLYLGAPWVAPGPSGWVALLVLVVVSTYLARITYFGAIARLGGGQLALLTPLETLLTVTWSILFLGEWLTPIQWFGGALILFSALLAIKRLGRARWRPPWRSWVKA